MGYLEVISMDDSGVTRTPISELGVGDLVEVELALSQGNYSLACVTCYKPIPSGMGHSYCERHKPNFPIHEECGLEQRGLYCSNCYTGRILTSPSGERYLEHR